jgi:hypothetical protein
MFSSTVFEFSKRRPDMEKAWEKVWNKACDDALEDDLLGRAVHNSPPPLDDVGSDVSDMLDEKDPVLVGQERKQHPLARGVLDYFPDALMEVAYVSYAGSQQHHPDKEMHWDKSKSTDEADSLLRHLKDRGRFDIDGVRHTAKVAWRALALLQRELEQAIFRLE